MKEEIFTNLDSSIAKDILLFIIIRVEALIFGLDLKLLFIESRIITISKDQGIGLFNIGPTA